MLEDKTWQNQNDFEIIIDLHFLKLNNSHPLEVCGSRQRDTTSSGWKFQLNNLAVMGLERFNICFKMWRIQPRDI